MRNLKLCAPHWENKLLIKFSALLRYPWVLEKSLRNYKVMTWVTEEAQSFQMNALSLHGKFKPSPCHLIDMCSIMKQGNSSPAFLTSSQTPFSDPTMAKILCSL